MTTGFLNLKPTTLLAVAALALVSGAASAQSTVTIYGNIDAGLLVQSNTPVGVSSPQVYNGGISPSIWGFRGSEDLGGGLKANFNLESHFAVDTGASTAPLFRRQANVGLSSDSMGTVTLGTMYSPAVLAFAATDPRGLRENFSGLYSWAFNSGALAAPLANANSDVGVFLHNAISYSNTLGPVNLSLGYSVAEEKSGASTGAVLALGATYSGPVSLSAAYQATDRANTSDRVSTMYSLGAGYAMGALTGKLNYLHGVNKSAAGVDVSSVDVLGLGVDWKLAANNTVIAAAYFGKDKNNTADKTSSYILSDEYALSKRTTLYGQVAFVNTDKGSTLLTSIAANATKPDTNTTFLNIGVKHSF